jgi:putative sigma-54 modulation protein
MQIEITGHGVEVTPALRDYTNEKFGRIVRHFEQLIGTHVVMHLDKNSHRIEATITASHKRFHAESTASDMYAAIDLLTDKLDQQVRKHKEKVTDHHRADGMQRKTGT